MKVKVISLPYIFQVLYVLYFTRSRYQVSVYRTNGPLVVYQWSGVRPSSTISNKNISATSGPITTKFYLKHHLVGGKAAIGFGPDRIRTLVFMATESSHRVIMEKMVSPLFLGCLSSDPFHTYRAMMTCMRAQMSFNFGLIGPPTAELAALERVKKSP